MKKIIKGTEVDAKLKTARPMVSSFQERGIITQDELKSQDKGQQIIRDAQGEANRIREEASRLKAQVEAEMEKAKKSGYREGKEAGYAELTEEILQAKLLKEKFLETCEPDVLKLVMTIAEKVLGDLTQKYSEAIRSIVKQALAHSLGEKIVVKIHPKDMKRLSETDLQFKDILDRSRHLHIKEDESIQPGGCVVATEIGTIDAQLETQLKAIRKALGV